MCIHANMCMYTHEMRAHTYTHIHTAKKEEFKNPAAVHSMRLNISDGLQNIPESRTSTL